MKNIERSKTPERATIRETQAAYQQLGAAAIETFVIPDLLPRREYGQASPSQAKESLDATAPQYHTADSHLNQPPVAHTANHYE